MWNHSTFNLCEKKKTESTNNNCSQSCILCTRKKKCWCSLSKARASLACLLWLHAYHYLYLIFMVNNNQIKLFFCFRFLCVQVTRHSIYRLCSDVKVSDVFVWIGNRKKKKKKSHRQFAHIQYLFLIYIKSFSGWFVTYKHSGHFFFIIIIRKLREKVLQLIPPTHTRHYDFRSSLSHPLILFLSHYHSHFDFLMLYNVHIFAYYLYIYV